MARVARVQARLGAQGPVQTAMSFFDEHLRVEQVAHFAGTQLRQGWSYRFDPLRPQRRVGRTDMVVERPGWAWGYNERGEVTSAQRTQSAAGAAPVAGQSWGYGYDGIGNRLQATRSTAQVAVIDRAPQNMPETMSTSYMPNRFNQYAAITRPEALEVSGVTDPAVPEVTVMIGPDDPTYAGMATLELPDGQTRPVGNGEPGGYGLWVVGNEVNTLGQWPLLSVTASRPGVNPNDPPITQTQSGRVWVRPTEAPVHDDDGNLVSDGGWTYEWDAENRLIAAERKADDLPEDLPQMRLEFHYDWLSRRVATVTQSKAPNATTWTTVETRHFWYDGWNLMAETVVNPPASGATGSVAVTHRYAWGVDLGGTWETGMGNHGPGRSQTAAGGVGALLGVIAPNDKTYSTTHDANGNVMGFIDLETGVLAARFDYDAFGTLITDWSAPGHHAWEISRIRFSGKYQDPHTGWLYYGYRYLDTLNGRWVSRDPIGEEGGLNLYGMVGNSGVNESDYLGMVAVTDIPRIMRANGMSNGASLMDHWFGGSGVTNKATITMNWVLGYRRAKTVWDDIVNNKLYVNRKAQEVIVRMLKSNGKYYSGGPFGKLSGDVEVLDKDYVQQRPVGSIFDPIDDMFAALGKFNLRVLVKGNVCVLGIARLIRIEKIGIYVADSYDFTGWQPLGFWNSRTNYAGKDPTKGDFVENADFRRHGGGRDFKVFSEVKIKSIRPATNFIDPPTPSFLPF